MAKGFRVDEFIFESAEDAQLALKEKKQVEYLKNHMKNSSIQNVMMLYEKANQDRLFKTPIGTGYMQEMHTYLIEAGIPDDKIEPIYLHVSYETKLRERTEPAKRKVAEAKNKKEEKKKLTQMSLVLNLLLIGAVIAMFIITLHSNNPNILNYENVLQDRYAQWEQELTEREQIIREKESQLLE